MGKTWVAYFMKWAIPCMKNKFSCIKVFYCFNVTVNTISLLSVIFFIKQLYCTAKMITHAGILLIIQNILHKLDIRLFK